MSAVLWRASEQRKLARALQSIDIGQLLYLIDAARMTSQANVGDDAEGGHASEPSAEPASRPAAGRSAAATSEVMDVTAGETAPATDWASVARQARASKVDWSLVAAAYRAKPAVKAPPVAPVKLSLAIRYDPAYGWGYCEQCFRHVKRADVMACGQRPCEGHA
jgi:hypothetical protein